MIQDLTRQVPGAQRRIYETVKWKVLACLLFITGFHWQNAAAQTIQIGTGTSVTSATEASAINIYYRSMHIQYLFTAAEINALGINGPQQLDSLGFNVIGAPLYALPNFTVKLGTTLAAALDTSVPAAALTTVYTNASYMPTANAWNMLGFTAPYAWNGTSNIVVDVCFDQVSPSYNSSGTLQYTNTSPVHQGIFQRLDGSPQCGVTPTQFQYNRANTKFHFIPFPACTGTPTITSLTPAGPINTCAAATQSFFVNVPNAAGYTFQWEKSATGAAPWTPIVGATGMTYIFGAGTSSFYHVIVTCSGSGASVTSSPIQLITTPPAYATIPYFQDFENWQNYCDSNDVPSNNWSNQPSKGNTSWRRDDQGASANWYSATGGVYTPRFVSGSHSAMFSTYSTYYSAQASTLPGNLDLYLNCSATAGPKELYFYMNNVPSGNNADSLVVLLSVDGGTTFSRIGGFDTANGWRRKMLPIATNSAQTVVRFQARRFGNDYSNIGLDSIYVAPECAGQPTAGIIVPASPVSGCPGYTNVLTATGTSLAGNLNYQWIQKANGATTWTTAVGGSGANTVAYTTPALFDTIQYRMIVTCGTSGLRDTTPVVVINVDKPRYASLPFAEDFESWGSRCFTTDIPSPYWSNFPASGNNSWRRHDQGASASWTALTSYLYSPVAAHGSYSARFHSGAVASGNTGTLDLFVNCSTIPGNKELQFYYINTSGTDSLKVLLSTDAGLSFTNIGNYSTNSSWSLITLPISTTASQVVIRFVGRSDNGSTDIGLDYVRILPPCAGKPTAGTIAPVMPCANTDFLLQLQNNSQTGGLTYQWQQSANGTVWTSAGVTNATQLTATANISTPTYFRCIVTCTNGNASDTTASYLVQTAPFYFCYCNSAATNVTSTDNIGKYMVMRYPSGDTLLSNGPGAPLYNFTPIVTYSDFRNTIAPVPMYQDSVYTLSMQQVESGSSAYTTRAVVFIDFNRNGIFEAGERVIYKAPVTTTTPPLLVADTFRVPDTAQVGITGMRVIITETSSTTINPCGTYTYGETEDYLAEIKYPPCDGPTNPGIARTSDTSMCPGYSFTLTDTTHEKYRSGITWIWQQSLNNGNSWNNIPASANKDTFTQIFTGAAQYRLQMTCSVTNDITYSNAVNINVKPPYKCYCYSIATGGAQDSSDIGAFSIGNFVVNTNGPHLLNPMAIKGRTDYTDLGPIELYTDSTYSVQIYHTLKGKNHADARITMFMDFNNNLQYDIPSERIVLSSDISSSNGWYVINNITIPSAVIPNVPTGMRVILNNNLAPNVPSDDACGPYVSGETEDYVVIFRKRFPTGVGHLDNVQDLALYPNPTEGHFSLSFTTSNAIKEMQVSVTSMTGQRILQETFSNIANSFNKDFDLTQQARGIYFVEIRADNERIIRKVVLR